MGQPRKPGGDPLPGAGMLIPGPGEEAEVIAEEMAEDISAASARMRCDLTKGSILGHIIRLALPSMATTALISSYHAINTFFIGHIPGVGTQALAAMGVWGNFFMLFIVFNQVVGIGSVALISRSFGAKNYEETKIIIGQTFMFKLGLALAVTVLGLLFTRQFYVLFGSEPAVVQLGWEYGSIFLLGLPLFFSGFTLNTAFKGIGDMAKPLYISIFAVMLNIFFDYALIFGNLGFPAMGIRGAAVSSIIAQAWTLAAQLFIWTTGRTFIKLEPRHFFQLSWFWVSRILRIGVPAAVGENVRQFGQFAVARVINGMGTSVMAAHTVIQPVMGFFWIPLGGFGEAVVTMVGQNLGAGKPERAEKSVYIAMATVLSIAVLVSACVSSFAPQVVGLFTQDASVIPTATGFMRIAAVVLLFVAASMTIGAAYWGSGDTKPPMYIAIATTWLVNVPLVLLFIYKLHFSVFSIYWAGFATEALNLALFFWLFRLGRWKRVRV